jgi:hypothetical protein
MNYSQAQELFKMIEVSVPVQQGVPVKQAEGCNQTVNRLPDSPPSLAEIPEIYGGCDGQVLATRVKDLELAKRA